MANETSNPQAKPQPQQIPLAKIHDLPGVFISKLPDKSYGGLVSSIQASGVKEAVILRLREDGEYQLVSGYRRRRASELAKKTDIPAHVYEMTLQEAIAYYHQAKSNANVPIPGKLVEPVTPSKAPDAPAAGEKPKEAAPAEAGKGKAGEKATAGPTPPKEDKAPTIPKAGDQTAKPATPDAGEKPQEAKPTEADKGKEGEKAAAGSTPAKEDKIPATPKAGEQTAKPAAPTTGEKPKEAAPAEAGKGKEGEKAAAGSTPAKEDKIPATSKAGEQVTKPAAPATGEKPKEAAAAETGKGKEGEKPTVGPTPPKEDKAPATPKAGEQTTKSATPTTGEKPKEAAPAEAGNGKEGEKVAAGSTPAKEDKAPVTGPAAQGPSGTAITQVFEDRLAPPDEKALASLPSPEEGESFFIILHPGYLEKSKYNKISVDQKSEDYLELKRSIERNGVKDPVLTRINPEGGGLEIVSGQRRHMIARELNYPVPAIIQKLDDADVMILVNDGNLHRPHISTYDLARALRGKMEGMKQKAGRRKKGFTAEELNSDEKLAKEMGMSVSKLNRILRLSEASEEVCGRIDDGRLAISTASALSFLSQKNQDMVMHLMDLGYKAPTDRIEYLKKVEKAGKLDEMSMRKVLEGINVLEPPKVVTPPPAAQPTPTPPAAPGVTTPTTPPAAEERTVIPPSPDVKQGQPETPQGPAPNTPPAPTAETTPPPTDPGTDRDKGEQDRPEYTKVILAGDRLRKYFPDVSMTPREIEESVYEALEERRQRQEKLKQKDTIFKKSGPTR